MEILKNFLGGLNTDDSIDFLPDGDYPYLANGIIGKTYNGKTGVLENVLGQSSHEAISGTGYTLIYELRSPKDGVTYLFYQNTTPSLDTIIKQDGETFTKIIESEFLDFANADINGGGIAGNLLYYSDGNDPKCVHLTRYAVTGPASQEEILLIKRGPQTAPTLATSLDGSAEDIVRFEDWQFAYLYTYFDGQTSVLSPYSEMLRPTLNSKEYNTITVTFPSGDEPVLAKEKKLYVRKGNSGTFTEIGSVSRSTVGGAFSGSTISFNGKSNGYVLETSYTKQFELVPPFVKTLCLSNNRVWLGNYTTGYDKYSSGNITINAGTEITATTSGANGSECVAGNSAYKYGFILKDSSGRTSSVVTDETYIIKSGNFIDSDPTLSPGFGVANFDVDLTGLPSWCTVVSMVISKDTIKSSYSYGFTTDIDYYTVVPGGTDTDTKTWANTVTYLRLSIGTSVLDNGVGFLPAEGDIVSFTESDGTEVNLRVEDYDEANQQIFCTPYDIGTIAATDERYFQVYRPKSIDEVAFYEFGADMVVSAGSASGTFTFTDSVLVRINSDATDIDIFTNTDFTSGSTGWFQGSQSTQDWTFSGGEAHIDPSAYAPSTQPSITEVLYQPGIDAGKQYTISFEITALSGSSDYRIAWLDGSNTVISNESFVSSLGVKSYDRTAPTGAVRLGLYFARSVTNISASITSFRVITRPLFPVMFIRDGSGIWNTSHGRIFVVSPVEGVEKKTFFKHSSPYIVGSQVNGLSEFAVGDESSVSVDAGEIQVLQPTIRDSSQSSVILAICNSDTYSIYVGEARLSQGANSLFASSGVIGDVRRQQAGFGTLHPSSVREVDGQVFWWDQLARAYCRYDSNGVFPISNYKCIKHFEDQSLLNDETDKVITGYDPFYKMIFVTFPNASTAVKKTIGFSIPLNRWVGFFNFAPVAYIHGTSNMYMPDATLNNKILKLSSTASFNSFYDNDVLVRYKTKVTMPFNAPTILEWRSFMMQCSPSLLEYSGGLQKVKDSAITVTAYNEEGQSTNILWDEFEPYENVLFGYFPMDSNTPVSNPLLNGDPMYSQTLSVDIEFGQTAVNQTHNWIKIAKAGSEISTGHSL